MYMLGRFRRISGGSVVGRDGRWFFRRHFATSCQWYLPRFLPRVFGLRNPAADDGNKDKIISEIVG
jgi:hypothetical protein